MAEPKPNDFKRIDNFLKSFMDNPQKESSLKAFRNFETKVDAIHDDLRKKDVTKEQFADLLPNRQDLLTRLEKLVAPNKALLKAKYQPEGTDN